MQERTRFELKLRHLPILAAALMAVNATDAAANNHFFDALFGDDTVVHTDDTPIDDNPNRDSIVPTVETPAKAERGDPEIVTVNPRSVTIKNGAGEKLTTAPLLGSRDKVGVNPPAEDLDGTLVIETEWENGKRTTHKLYHKPGHKVSVSWTWIWDEAQRGWVNGWELIDLGPIEKKERGGGD